MVQAGCSKGQRPQGKMGQRNGPQAKLGACELKGDRGWRFFLPVSRADRILGGVFLGGIIYHNKNLSEESNHSLKVYHLCKKRNSIVLRQNKKRPGGRALLELAEVGLPYFVFAALRIMAVVAALKPYPVVSM